MRTALFAAMLVAGCAAGSIIGTGLALSSGSGAEPVAAATTTLVDVKGCPSGTGALGQLRRGMPVLVTARSQDATFFEISYPLSPNGRGWLPASDIEVGEDVVKLPVRDCLPILVTRTVGPSPAATATGTPVAASSIPPSPTPPPAATGAAILPTPAPPSSTPSSAPPPPVTTATAIPPSATPPPPPTATPGDTLPPAISQPALTPQQINGPNLQQKCPPRAMTFNVTATVSDNVGVQSVVVQYPVATAAGATQTAMTLSQGRYSATVGPFNPQQTAEMTITVVARDAAGNQQTLQVGSVTVNDCR